MRHSLSVTLLYLCLANGTLLVTDLPVLARDLSDTIQTDTLPQDTAVVTLKTTIEVVGQRITRNSAPFPFEKDRFNQLLASNGFRLTTRGGGLTQDIQSDAFKRDDITVVIDGERYHSACPNRMDSPLARSNSLEMDAIELNKTSSSATGGLGGSVSYRRQAVEQSTQLRAGLSHSLGSSDLSDFGFAATTDQMRLSGRYAVGETFEDGESRSFADRYGYLREPSYKLAEIAFTGEHRSISPRADFTYTENVPFPYLQMDERLNRVFSSSISIRGHKLYANHTSHLMDNRLRQSTMLMSTDATNLTLGLVGPHYELFYRRWYADNIIASPSMTIRNDLIPDVRQLSASLYYDRSTAGILYWVRGGLSRFSMHEQEREAFFEPLYGDLATTRTFVNLGLGAALRRQMSDQLSGVLTLDVAAEPPSAQALYIAVQRMMTKPWWSGNPGLDQPVRVSLRGKVRYRKIALELSGGHVWNYADMISRTVGTRAYQTYDNFNMQYVSAHLNAQWNWVAVSTGYTYAERTATHTPLAEIPPFFVSYTLTSPLVGKSQVYWRQTYNDAQTRVDRLLTEIPTTSWHRVDIGASYLFGQVKLSMEVENLFDKLYSQHLSYLRDPFASGVRVYEPGRTVRLNLIVLATKL